MPGSDGLGAVPAPLLTSTLNPAHDPALTPALFQPEAGLWIAPIRHHSPACAFAVRAMIRALRPDFVLIEAPADLLPLVAPLCDSATRPPVAAVTLLGTRAAYLPFAAHSPEYVAMQSARETGAEIRLIDLPTGARFGAADRATDTGPDTGPNTGPDTGPKTAPQTGPLPLTDERPFDDGDYIRALCARTGCRDGFELWDHLFESRLGEAGWQSLFTDIGSYCAGLRAATPKAEIAGRDNARREAAMRGHIAAALEEGRVVAVVGGFHAPALVTPRGPAPKVPAMQDSYLIRYSHAQMDALAGYGAGLPQPGFYDAVWSAAEAPEGPGSPAGPPDWSALATGLMQDFTAAAARDGHEVSLPAKVEALRLACSLAAMRGREAVLRHDLFDAVQTALTKGELSARTPWSERLRHHWRGTALGEVSHSAAQPPLVRNTRRRARAHRLDISDAQERHRTLDIYRKPAHLATARFLHAMGLIAPDFARMEAGPDYTSGGAGRLFERWRYAWSPAVETQLIGCAAAGADTVEDACLATLRAAFDEADALSPQLDLIARAVRAGLGTRLGPFTTEIAANIAGSADFAALAEALARLHGLCHTRGPMRPPEALALPALLQSCYARVVYLINTLPQLPEDGVGPALAALRLVADLLATGADTALDPEPFHDAMARLASAAAPPEIVGAALALALRAGQIGEARLLAALEGTFHGVALEAGERTRVLRGLIATAPDLLWTRPGLLAATDRFMVALDEADFMALLPEFRRAFATLGPRETDRLAEVLARRHGIRPDPLAAPVFTEAERAAARAVEAALRADGLWEASS